MGKQETLTKKMKLNFTTFSEIIINKENGKIKKEKLKNNEKRIIKNK